MKKIFLPLILLSITMVFAQEQNSSDTQEENVVSETQEQNIASSNVEVNAEHNLLDNVKVNGFVSTSYNYNFNEPASQTSQFRAFDSDHNRFNADGIELVIQKEIEEGDVAGFRFDVTAGSTIPQGSHSTGLFAGDDFDLQQAYVSYAASDKLTFDIGKFVTHVGYELIDGYDGFNDNYSRGVIFNFAGPFTHTGVKANYSIDDKNSLMIMVANGWDNTDDNNTGKTFGLQYAHAISDDNSVAFNYVGGPEQTGDASNLRHLFDLVGSFKVSDKINLGLNAVYGTEKDAVVVDEAAQWLGVALFPTFNVSDKFYVGVRAEYLSDMDGSRIGEQDMFTFTATPSYKASDNLTIRAEVRYDMSNEDVFVDSSGLTDSQTTAGLNAVYVF